MRDTIYGRFDLSFDRYVGNFLAIDAAKKNKALEWKKDPYGANGEAAKNGKDQDSGVS